MSSIEPRKNQRKTPLTPKKRDSEETPTIYAPMRIGGGRIKKAKIPFDPSESYVPKRRLTTYIPPTKPMDTSTTQHNTLREYRRSRRTADIKESNKLCAFCSKYDYNKASINCRDCTAVAHLTCIRSNNGPFLQNDEKNWSCPSCETCLECYETGHLQPLYKCCLCFSPYHLDCHDVNSKIKARKSRFHCRNCNEFNQTQKKRKPIDMKRVEFDKLSTKQKQRDGFAGFQLDEISEQAKEPDDDDDDDQAESMEILSDVSVVINRIPDEDNDDAANEIIETVTKSDESKMESFFQSGKNLANPSTWTCDDVFNYFYAYFPRDAHIFIDEEIDGSSLLLLKRSDLARLKLKLGVALRMYIHVLRFQTGKNDITMAWA